MARADYEIKAITTAVGAASDEEWDWLERFDRSLRSEDIRELQAVHEGSTFMGILDSVYNSERAYRVTGANGEPLVLYGKCAEANLPGRLIWCMATVYVKQYEREFARVSRQIVKRWAEEHGILWNAVGEWNEPAKRWLKWCGAEFGTSLKMNGEPFVRFYIRGGK